MNEEDHHVSVQLIAAVQRENVESVREQIHRGVNSVSLNSGLCWAARLGSLPLVTLLLEHGADVNCQICGGFSPLLWASLFSGSTEVVKRLIACGGDVNVASAKRVQTPLHAAIIRADIPLAKLFIEAGSNIDATDYLGKTALLHSVQRNLIECVKLLILNNCDINKPGFCNGNRLSPLLVALFQSNFEVTKMLILAGAKFEQMSIYQTYTISRYYRTVEDVLKFELRPIYLKQQCRVCIRQLIKPQFLQKLKEMELPPALKDFLSMEELNWMY